jgi:hypothetical protein
MIRVKAILFLCILGCLALSGCVRSAPIKAEPYRSRDPASGGLAATASAPAAPEAALTPEITSEAVDEAVGEDPGSQEAASEVVADARYVVQTGTPVGVVNFVNAEAGCNWMGVGGQIFNLSTQPITGLEVRLGGSLAGNAMNRTTLSGQERSIGPGGFQISLGDLPTDSRGALWLQIFDGNGIPQSEKVFFDTFSGCDRNFILVNFLEVFRVRATQYLPWVGKTLLVFYFPFVGKP